MSASANTPDSRRGGAATAERILDAAERLFAERGYPGTTLRAIAAEVGIQNPSLYKHFANKAALYDAVLERAIHPLLYEFWDKEGEIERGMRHLAEHPQAAQLMLHETLSGTDDSTPGVARWVAAIFGRTESWLPDMPGLDPDAVPLRVLAIYHVVAGYFASAATYRALTGRDLHGPRAVEEQIRIVSEISDALFAKLSERGAQERV
jgi:AcrR family transcriptional regulator